MTCVFNVICHSALAVDQI